MNDKLSDNDWGFCPDKFEQLEPHLKFLYEKWWKVEFFGLDRLPESGPCLIVGNQGSVVPWQALMLSYAVAKQKKKKRRLYVLAHLDSIADERLKKLLVSIGFVDWSSKNMKKLFEQNELVAVFPEGQKGLSKPFSQRYRLEEFDWTMLMPAVESGIQIFPLAALGFDEATPSFLQSKIVSSLIKLSNLTSATSISWLPSPFSLISCPVEVSLNLLKPALYEDCNSHDEIETGAKSVSLWLQGEIQADLNRQLRHRGS